MPDKRKHRGPHPQDAELFGPAWLPRLAEATAQLSTLLGWGYAINAAVTLVGDHHQLHRRHRIALKRSATAPDSAAHRLGMLRPIDGARIAVDGFNVVVSLEAALAGGVLLLGRDRRIRDLASMHGTWRRMAETHEVLDQLARVLEPAAEVHWVLDRPVSNSGRLAGFVRERGWTAELHDQADGRLVELATQEGFAVATADGPLLDRVPAAVDLVGPVVSSLPAPFLVDLSQSTGPSPLP